MRRLGWLLALVAFGLPGRVGAQISPGPLARAHQSLEGATQCAQCHGSSREAMPRLCLICHKEVTLLVSQGRGYHARGAKTSGKSCASCHPDHAGREFAMIAWPAGGRDRFDHETAGWALEGKHAPVTCTTCHAAKYRRGPAALISPRKGSVGWLGLETACASCHAADDPHQNALGPTCDKCHTASAWDPAPKFQHATSRYPLTGAHEQVACAKCHLAPTLRIVPDAEGKRTAVYRPLPFAECSNCHADPHKGRLSPNCSDCHVTEGFSVLDRRGFNHALTRYPLLGRHRQVSCERCHGQNLATPRPASSRCASCHADRHAGEATLRDSVVDCAACHRVEGFAPATFTVAAHSAARFPLAGKHQLVPCASCHTTTGVPGKSAPVTHVRVAFATCTSCHTDPHAAQLPDTRCERCHGDQGWGTLQYDLASHARTTLPLEGRHAALACSACHGPTRPGLRAKTASASLGKAGVQFHLTETRCADCHADPHAVTGMVVGPDSVASCGACHNAASFRPATIGVVSHAQFAFPLEGAHRAVACRDCHTGLPIPGGPVMRGGTLVGATRALAKVPLGVPKGTACASCHEGPHGNQFANRADRGRCDACHTSARFTGTLTFDHERQSSFSLQGAHTTVPCASCHRTEPAAGVRRVVYRPLATTCESCHRGNTGGLQ